MKQKLKIQKDVLKPGSVLWIVSLLMVMGIAAIGFQMKEELVSMVTVKDGDSALFQRDFINRFTLAIGVSLIPIVVYTYIKLKEEKSFFSKRLLTLLCSLLLTIVFDIGALVAFFTILLSFIDLPTTRYLSYAGGLNAAVFLSSCLYVFIKMQLNGDMQSIADMKNISLLPSWVKKLFVFFVILTGIFVLYVALASDTVRIGILVSVLSMVIGLYSSTVVFGQSIRGIARLRLPKRR